MFTLHNGDCLQVMPTIPSGSIDAIITDLPYGTTACAWDEVIPLVPMWEHVKRVLKSSGVFITTASQPFASTLVSSEISMFREELIWLKNRGASGLQATKKNIKVHENIFVFSKFTGYTFNPQKWNVTEPQFLTKRKTFDKFEVAENNIYSRKQKNRKADDGTRNPISIVSFVVPVNAAKSKMYLPDTEVRIHPTQKPVALYEYLIKTYTNEGETVLDIAMGSGTTIEAAERTGRNSIGIEKDKAIFETAVLRLKSFTPSNNRLHMDAGDSPRLPSQSTLEGFTPAEQGHKPAPRQ